MINYNPLLENFTAGASSPNWQRSPFQIGKHDYATDAHLIIKTPHDPMGNLSNDIDPNIKDTILGFFKNSSQTLHTIDVMQLDELIAQIPMLPQYENAKHDKTCLACDGDGKVEWNFDIYVNEFDCPVCDGDGKISDRYLKPNGDKVHDPNYCIDILDCRFNPAYLQKITAAASYLKETTLKIVKLMANNKMVLFKIDECYIGIMPLLHDEEHKTIKLTPH